MNLIPYNACVRRLALPQLGLLLDNSSLLRRRYCLTEECRLFSLTSMKLLRHVTAGVSVLHRNQADLIRFDLLENVHQHYTAVSLLSTGDIETVQ